MRLNSQTRSAISDQRSAISDQRSAIVLAQNPSPLLLGMVLLAAGILKAMPDGYAQEVGFLLGSHWLAAAAVGIEITLGLWLVFGLWAKQARWSAIVAFLALSASAASKGFLGHESCNCFGRLIEVSPWLMFTFDLGAVAALWLWCPEGIDKQRAAIPSSTAYLFFALAAFVFALGGLSALRMAYRLPSSNLVVKGPSRVEMQHSDRRQPVEANFVLYNSSYHDISIRRILADRAGVTATIPSNTIRGRQEATLSVRIAGFGVFDNSFLHRIEVDTDAGNVILWVTGNLPASQTVFYRPHQLFLEKDEKGGWRDRSVKFRLPKTHTERV